METRRRTVHRGFTLIELLVVIAIIAIIAGISAPAMVRFARMAGDDSRTAARDLQRVMRVAQVYATTHSVDTAVVYNINVVNDSMTDGVPVRIIDGMGVMRTLRAGEFETVKGDLERLYGENAIEQLGIDRRRLVVPVADRDEGGHMFREFPHGICILPVYADYGVAGDPRPSYAILDRYLIDEGRFGTRFHQPYLRFDPPGVHEEPGRDFGLNRRLNGYRSVQVLDLLNHDLPQLVRDLDAGRGIPAIEELFVRPRRDPGDSSFLLAYRGDRPWSFPAHLFLANGLIDAPSGRARLEVKVGPRPDLDEEERFAEGEDIPAEFQQAPVQFTGDMPEGAIMWERGPVLELFTTTGRIRLGES